MSQTSVTSYFATRKRRASEELRNKSKVLILDDNEKKEILALIPEEQQSKIERPLPSKSTTKNTKKEMAVRNLQFDLGSKPSRSTTRTRSSRSQKNSTNEDNRQTDIRETLLKVNKEIEADKNVIFEKLGCLSPKKSTKKVSRTSKTSDIEQNVQEPACFRTPTKSSPACFKTPTKSSPANDMNIAEIKTRLTTSSRLAELRARIAKFRDCEDKLEKLNQQHAEKKEEIKKNEEKIKIKEFERIQLEIPVSPQKCLRSPSKFLSPTKTIQLSSKASPARRLLFEPKEAPASPVKGSPTKIPAYQRFQSLIETEGEPLPLPYKYRFLSEVFRSIDTVCAMLYNRKEIITFSKLKPAVQELIRRNFTIDHLAQIKTIYPEAYSFRQEKMRSFGTSNPERYELVVIPNVESDLGRSGRNTPDEENVLKSAMETNMGPSVLLERKRKFNNTLLNIVKNEHEKFLLSLIPPVTISKEKIKRWHPEFDIENCRDIEKAELPQPPAQEKLSTAKDVLERANKLINDNSRIKKAIELLAENRTKIQVNPPTEIIETTDTNPALRDVEISIVDTPPATPKIQKPVVNSLLKGVPLALLEKVRAKQAAKALEMMTRSTEANKDAIMYARLPEMAKIIRNIFVGEKKNVLNLEFVIKKLDDSYRTKLTANELEEHIRLICKLLPLWATIHVVRKVNYLKLAKDFDMTKVIKRLEVLADEKA